MKNPTSKAFITLAVAALLVTFFTWDRTEPQPEDSPPLATPNESLALSISSASEQLLEMRAEQFEPSSPSLLELATQRRDSMKQLMKLDPDAALELAFSYREYHQLPAEIQALSERPFTQKADYQVLAVCFDKHHHSHHQYSIKTEDGVRHEVFPTKQNRLKLSKDAVPLQGIELDGYAVVRPTIFQRLADADLDWALDRLPLANSDPQTDFLTGAPLGESPVHAISGGYLFKFQDEQSFNSFESRLQNLDKRPGLGIGSPALLASLGKAATPFSEASFFSQQESAALPPPNEVRDFLIIRVDFQDRNGSPFSKQELEDLVNNTVAPTFVRYSYNKTTVDVEVTDTVFRLGNFEPYTSDTNKLYDDAIAAYIEAGNTNPRFEYDHIAISFLDLDYTWAGLASIGGQAQWLQGEVNPSTIVHELGHNYGLSHASYWVHDTNNPTSINPVDPSGENEEYGDPFDVMGDGEIDAGHFHMPAKQHLGWIENSDWDSLTSEADSGTYRIYAFDDVSATGLQALRVRKSGSSEHYWVGFRQAYPGISTFDRGAYIVWQRPGSSNNRSWLVDTTPLSADGKNDSGLAVGRTYSDTQAGLHITTLAKGQDSNGNYLDIAVNIGSFAGNQAPNGTLTASESGVARTGIPFSFVGTDPDGDPLSYHWDFGDGTVEISNASVDHEFPVGGTYTLTLTVSDRKGGSSVHQATVEVSDPITQITNRSSGTTRDLTALAANDTVIVAGGSGGTYLRSTDGETWTSHNPSGFRGNHTTYQIIWTGNSFIAVGVDFNNSQWVGIVYSSDDGIIWTEELRTTETVGNWGFVSIAEDPNSNTTVIVQSDGKLRVRDSQGNFTVVDFGLQNDGWKNEASVVWTGSSFVLGAYDFSQSEFSERLTIYRSPDGTNWTKVEASESGLLGWYGLSKLAYLNNSLIGSGFGSGIVYSSDHGESWRNNSANTDNRAEAFAYGNGIYSLHGELKIENGSSEVSQDFLSTDGRNWQPAGDPGFAFNDRIFFADTFISVGDNGLIVQSEEFFPPVQSPFEAWIVGFTTNLSDQGALANPDFDWAPNFLEYALGSDPTDGTSIPSAPALRFLEDGKIAVDINRLSKTDVTLSLESSTNLVEWDPLPTTTSTDTDLLLTLTTTQSFAANTQLFIRIKASQ